MTHCVLLLASGTFLCCGNDEGIAGHPSSVGGAGGGADEPLGGVSSNNPTAGTHAGGSVISNGGTSPTPAGNGGVSETPGGAANAGAAPIGGAGPTAGEELTVCDRLTQRSTHASNVARNYDHAVYEDCGTRWVTNLYLVDKARLDFLNALETWNQAFWGCGQGAVQNFALVYGTPALSAGDAAALIDKYMTIASSDLQLSPAEQAEMQAALERLAQQDIADPSLELSGSLCEPVGSGGAGGAGGDGVGGANGQGTAGANDIATAGHGGAP